MGRVKYLLIISSVALLVFACSNKKQPTSSNDNDTYFAIVDTGVVWAGTEVLFTDSPDQKEYSLLYFEARWCSWCRKLKQETLSDSLVILKLNKYFNCIRLDIDADTLVQHFDSTLSCRQFSQAYGISGIPNCKIFNQSDSLIGSIVGYKVVDEFLALLNDITKNH